MGKGKQKTQKSTFLQLKRDHSGSVAGGNPDSYGLAISLVSPLDHME